MFYRNIIYPSLEMRNLKNETLKSGLVFPENHGILVRKVYRQPLTLVRLN